MNLFARLIFAGLMVGFFLLIGVSSGWAHDHSGQGMSPFHGKDRHHAVHCDLLGHNIHKPCPLKHHGSKEKGDTCFLSSPCGDAAAHHSGSVPNAPMSPVIHSSTPSIFVYPEMMKISISTSLYPSVIPVALEHPPRISSAIQS